MTLTIAPVNATARRSVRMASGRLLQGTGCARTVMRGCGEDDRLLGDALPPQPLGAAARTTVEARFSLETTIERLLHLYGRFDIDARPAGAAHAVPPPATVAGGP